MQRHKEHFIELAVYAKALKFGEFTLKSGRISPYFFTSGAFCTGELTRGLAAVFAESISRAIKPEKYDIVFAPAYKGIPLAVSVSMALAAKGIDKPWCFDRKEAKEHGDKGALVGAPVLNGQKAIVLDDVITTGAAKGQAIAKLKAGADISIAGLFILLDRQEKGKDGKNAILEFEKKYNTKVYPIVTADEIFAYLSKNKVNGKLHVTGEMMERYEKYREKYGV